MKKTIEEIIKDYVTTHKITGHSQILDFLLNKHDINVNQSTLSRKLKKCSIAKIDGYYQIIGQSNNTSTVTYRLSQPNMIVVSTLPGHANSYAYQFDVAVSKLKNKEPFTSILGTIAGDDTMVIITDGVRPLNEIKESIEKLF